MLFLENKFIKLIILVILLQILPLIIFGCGGGGGGSTGGGVIPAAPTNTPTIYVTPTIISNYIYSSSFGSKGREKGQFLSPYGVALDSSGNIYITDTLDIHGSNPDYNYSPMVNKFSPNGDFIIRWSDGNFPCGISVDSFNNIYTTAFPYLSSNKNFQTFKYNNLDGALIKSFGDFYFKTATPYQPDIAIDSLNNCYITNFTSSEASIIKYDCNGNYITKYILGSQIPAAICIDKSSNDFIVVTSDNYIRKFDSNGDVKVEFGGYTATYEDGKFYEAMGATTDSYGNIYVCDYGIFRVQKFDSNGNFITKWGRSGDSNGQFVYPTDVAVNSTGTSVYVVDSGNYRIQKFISQ